MERGVFSVVFSLMLKVTGAAIGCFVKDGKERRILDATPNTIEMKMQLTR
jgi:hypothetical protein